MGYKINRSQEKKLNILFFTMLSILFLNIVQILIFKNNDFVSYCQSNICSKFFLIDGQNFLNLPGFQLFFPAITLFIAFFIMLFGNIWKKFTHRENILGFFTVLTLAIYIFFQFSQFIPETYIDSIYYLFGILEICLATIWATSYRYQQKWQFLDKKFSIYDVWSISALILIVIGVYISATDSSVMCSGFPICHDIMNLSINGFLVMFHRILAVIVTIVSIYVLQKTWFYYRKSNIMLISTTLAFSLFVGQILIGALQVLRNFPLDLVGTHAVSAAAFYISLMISVIISKIEKRDDSAEKLTIFNDKQRLSDFVKLNKPIIVLLLLVTTYGGMVVGGGKIPELSVTFWTLLAGGLAAGGSSAINQYIDRDIDQSMQRTSRRPLPAGRLLPAEALALGIAEIVFAFFIYAGFVNLLSAVLAMVGMVYYVFIYSLWLKHLTVQNIVIGGGAGAIPPLVGWAAVTGSLNIPSLFLFGLVFLWTPPHFWALAIVRKNDYARANVPMMPVILGEKKTRSQIFIYTIQLFILTLLMPIFKLGGTFFLISAIVLGLWLLYSAWQVVRIEGNKVAYKMYRYSSMYLVFIFLALTIDVFI